MTKASNSTETPVVKPPPARKRPYMVTVTPQTGNASHHYVNASSEIAAMKHVWGKSTTCNVATREDAFFAGKMQLPLEEAAGDG